MKKILIILLTIATLLTLSACNQNSVDNSNIVSAATQIAYNGEEIAVSSIILKCDDKFYGIEVNEGVNFCNKNNYFTTSSGLTIILTNEDLEPGINTEDGYTSIQKLEDRLFLVVKGSDEKKVNDVFNHIFKANGEMYQMFKHDINSDWTKEVVITNDVISFSNGEDTTYIYQNPGSLSPGCYQGRIEPTVFYKQLRGIDIPITYPEAPENSIIDLKTYHSVEIEYTPYGMSEYETLKIGDYIPYSIYDLSDKLVDIYNKNDNTKSYTKVFGYILLANKAENVLNLFETFNDYNKYYCLLTTSTNIADNYYTEILKIDLSKYYKYADEVVNSDNRYHFGLITNNMQNESIDNYELDVNDWIKNDLKNIGQSTIYNDMQGILVSPTMKIKEPVYNKFHSSGLNTTYDIYYGAEIDNGTTISNHGAQPYPTDYLIEPVNGWANGNYLHGTHMYILEGDYIYYLLDNYSLGIYENISTVWDQKDKESMGYDNIQILPTSTYFSPYDLRTNSCSLIGGDSLLQNYKAVSVVQY